MFITEIDEIIVRKFDFLVEEYHFEGPYHDETLGPYLQSDFSYRKNNLMIFLEISYRSPFTRVTVTFDKVWSGVEPWERTYMNELIRVFGVPIDLERYKENINLMAEKIKNEKLSRDDGTLFEIETASNYLQELLHTVSLANIKSVLPRNYLKAIAFFVEGCKDKVMESWSELQQKRSDHINKKSSKDT